MPRISLTSLASSRSCSDALWVALATQGSTPSAPPRPRCRRRRPESRRPSGHRHSGSGSRCRLLLDPEGDGSFEQITLHPQPSVLALQLPQPRLLVSRQPVLLATVDAVLANPVPQGRVVDTKLT